MKIDSDFPSIFLDTNVLVYQTFEDFDAGKHREVGEVLILDKSAENEHNYVYQEVYRNAHKRPNR